MNAESLSLPATTQKPFLSLRALGTAGMIGAPMLLVEHFWRMYSHLPNNTDDRAVGVLEVFYITGWICTAVGMRRLRVTGSGVGARVVFVIQMIGLLLAEAFSLQDVLRIPAIEGSTFFAITDTAWPFSHVFMLVVGACVLAAGVWKGYRRFAPFIVGLALPIFLPIMIFLGIQEAGMIFFPLATATGFVLLGYAVKSSDSERN